MMRVVVAFLFFCRAFDANGLTIIEDNGGSIGALYPKLWRLKKSGEQVRIMGPCKSACTLWLASLPDGQVCIGPKAEFWFHVPKGRSIKYAHVSKQWAELLMSPAGYPDWVRVYIEANGGLNHRWVRMYPDYARNFMPAC